MALQWMVLASLVSFSLGQSTTIPMPSMTTDAVSVSSMTSSAAPVMTTSVPGPAISTNVVMATPTPTPGPMIPTDPLAQANLNLSISERYEFDQARSLRDAHFFCPTQGGSFPIDDEQDDAELITNNWTIFLQYPVLAYLDSMKKMFLINQIVALINLGGQVSNGVSINVDNICIGKVEHYDVSLYTESVLINIYRRDYLTLNTPNVTNIDAAFKAGVNAAVNANPPRMDLIQTFQGRNAIVISNNTYGRVEDNVHPGAFTPGEDGMRFSPDDDPTLRAVILGSWPRQIYLVNITSNAALNNSIIFAANPNPVFYGLTGGDIVFAVIATILCSLLAFLMVFGFCIQPFFM